MTTTTEAPIAAAETTTAAAAAPSAAVATTPAVAKALTTASGSSPIKAVKAEGSNSVIRMYESGTHGYIVFQQSTLDMSNPMWPKQRKRSTLIKGEKALLEAVVSAMVNPRTLEIEGTLIVHELLYDEAFQAEVQRAKEEGIKGSPYKEYLQQLNLKQEDEDLMLKDALKRAGNEGPVLTKHVDGEDISILKFTLYRQKPDAKTGQFEADILIQHDNTEEVADYRASQGKGE